MRKLKITSYQAWRFYSWQDEFKTETSRREGKNMEYELFKPLYPLGPIRETMEEAWADLMHKFEGPQKFDVVVPNPEKQIASGDLAKKPLPT